MTGDVTVRTDDGVLLRVPLAQLKIDKKIPHHQTNVMLK